MLVAVQHVGSDMLAKRCELPFNMFTTALLPSASNTTRANLNLRNKITFNMFLLVGSWKTNGVHNL